MTEELCHPMRHRTTKLGLGSDRSTARTNAAASSLAAVVVGLQRGAGNAAVASVLQRAAVTGPGDRLTSPRFTPHPILEECFQNRARLNSPASGPAVRAVQEALLERGHNLGAAGADAKYGPATAAAVRDFKTKEALGFEQFGDVGPGTMRRLDALFPGPEPEPDDDKILPDEADEETGEGSCPFTPDIVAGAVNRSPAESGDASASAFTNSQQAGRQAAGDTVGGGTHIDIPTAVTKFKDRVNASEGQSFVHDLTTIKTSVTEKGQFFWGAQLLRLIHEDVESMETDGVIVGDADAAAYGRKGMQAVVAVQNTGSLAAAAGLLREMSRIAARTKSPKKARMLALLRPARLTAGALEQLLWSQLNARPDASLPPLEAHTNYATFAALKKFDKTNCGGHALTMAARLRARGGLVPRDESFKGFSAFISAGRGVQDRRPRPAGSKDHLGDVIAQTGAAAAATKTQQALDAGRVVHARVLSGQGYGIVKDVPANPRARPVRLGPPPEEHSILIIGFDGNDFVFNDPDAAVSNEPEQGFGILHLVGSRLSTARDEDDLVVDSHGMHANHKTKRYQVISVSSV